jgi:SPP1 gp7 family putative phage head morphogenesis protein
VYRDPTRTKTLRSDFEAELFRRFRPIKGDIREAVQEKDVLYLGTQRAQNASPDPREYQFLTDEQKRKRFIAWLNRRVDEGVLDVDSRNAVRNGSHYTDTYIRKAYSKGVQRVGTELQKQGEDVEQLTLEELFNKPIHASKIERLYTRGFENLEGITEEMGEQISEELADGLSKGWNPRKMASEINDRVDKIGITRARVLAQTETIHAHAEGTLDRLESEGFEQVQPKVEFSTAGDRRVCPICASLQGNVYTIEEARGRLPVHPRCRCTWLPYVDS